MNDFKHECPEWDFMEITLNDLEAVGCSCFAGDPEADALYEARSRELDALNAKSNSLERT